MLAKHRILIVSVAVILIYISLARAADFEASLEPNATVEAGSGGVLFNLTINNTNQTVNLTMVNITLPSGFQFLNGTNQTSTVQALFSNDSVNLTWMNQTPEGFLANLSQEWFVFNTTTNSTPGVYYLIVTTLDTQGVVNSTNLSLNLVQCNSSLILNLLASNATSEVRGEPVDVQGYIEDACGNPIEGVLANWTFSRDLNNYTYEQHQSNQSLGYYNFTWNYTQTPYGWYNVSMNATKAGYPQNETLLEDSFHLGYVPRIPWVNMTRVSACPEYYHFWAEITDSESDYNNISVQARLWNQTSQDWGNWSVVNWTWQDQLANDTIDFYHNFSNGTWEPGVYSYRFYSLDEFGLSNSTNGTWSFQIHNCSRVVDIMTVPPTPGNGSAVNDSSFELNFSFTSHIYNLTECYLDYDNGTVHNYTENATSGYCSFSIQDQQAGYYNYSIYVGNEYTNDSWNGTWYVDVFPCTENWTYGSWGDCQDGLQYRTSNDLNSCGTYDNRSATAQACEEGSGGGGGGGGGVGSGDTIPVEIKIWRTVSPGKIESMPIARTGISASNINLQFTEEVKDCKVTVRGFAALPAQINVTPPGRVYNYMNITTTANSSSLAWAVIEFSVARSWVNENRINVSTIGMERLLDNWTRLETLYLGSDNESLNYRANTNGFSWFAVVGEVLPEEENVTEPEAPEPVPEEPEEVVEEPEEPEYPPGKVCIPGDTKCIAGLVLQECNAWGTGWISKARCLSGCRDGECVDFLVIEVDLSQVWIGIAGVMVLLLLMAIYTKRQSISDWLFWRF
jgi:PGF-pre-PGF domain-containing protein